MRKSYFDITQVGFKYFHSVGITHDDFPLSNQISSRVTIGHRISFVKNGTA